jgi:hypothetical protein
MESRVASLIMAFSVIGGMWLWAAWMAGFGWFGVGAQVNSSGRMEKHRGDAVENDRWASLVVLALRVSCCPLNLSGGISRQLGSN